MLKLKLQSRGHEHRVTWFKHIYFTTIGEQLYNYTSPESLEDGHREAMIPVIKGHHMK